MISIIHPTRSRPQKSIETIKKWVECSSTAIEIIVSLDDDDPDRKEYERLYMQEPFFRTSTTILFNQTRSSVSAINNGAMESKGQILIVVSDDTDCFKGWDTALYKATEGKTDYILKTQDGIQPYIITMPVLDRKYLERTGNIYDPGFDHLFCDTYMTCVADINGRKITSDFVFPHNNPGHYGKPIDDVNRKNDATWAQGEETFIRLMKQFTPEELSRIKDHSMRSWLRNKRVL
jgi:glycosyltransferase involved in cell wall biosynthesis